MMANTKKAVLEFTEVMRILTESGLSLRDALEVLVTTDRRSGGRAPRRFWETGSRRSSGGALPLPGRFNPWMISSRKFTGE